MSVINGIIKGVNLSGGEDNHGVLTLWVTIEFSDGGQQSYGGYAMDQWDSTAKRRVGTEYLGQRIVDLMHTFEVEDWSKFAAIPCRVERKDSFGEIDAIGHFMRGRWFSFERGFYEA